MTLPQQIAELCQLIHIFETNMRPIKQELFSINCLTPQLIWNSIINGYTQHIRADQLLNYFSKHGVNIAKKDMQLLVNVYSSRKDGQLNQGDLWQIFRPLHMRAVSDVLAVRNKRNVAAKCHEVHYKITDALATIVDKTLSFLKVAEMMKANIAKCPSQSVDIRPLDAAHLQIFVHPWVETLMRADIEVVLQHIIRNELCCEKTFWQFITPICLKSKGVNPNHKQKDQMDTRQCILKHIKTVDYVKSAMKKRPLYFRNDRLEN